MVAFPSASSPDLAIADHFGERLMPEINTKRRVLEALEALPDDATIEDAIERLCFMAKIQKGLDQAEAGETVPHDLVKKKFGR
jgi:hypothetical protein